jgi:solute carrier family 36 (proton-coupled amino acid transporter)
VSSTDLIFISANVNAYFGISKQLVVLLCVPPLVLFCLIRHIKQLAYVALVADVMNFTGLAVVFVADFTYMDFSTTTTGDGASSNALASLHWLGTLSSIPFFFGVATYCFAGIGMALPLENAMQHKRHFRRILLQTVALIATLYGTFGICGYLAFGAETQDVVTLNIAGRGSLATIVKLCLCGGLLCACPMMLFPVFEVLQPACLSPLRLHDRSARTEQVRYPDSGLKPSLPAPSVSHISVLCLQAITILFRACVVVAVALLAGGAPSTYFSLWHTFHAWSLIL